MSDIVLNVKALPGAMIADVCAELIRMANQLNITVMSTFNGVRLMACPGDDAEGLEEAWRRELAQLKAYQSIARDIYFCNPEFPDGKPTTNTTATGMRERKPSQTQRER